MPIDAKKIIIKLRKKHYLTQEQLASLIGVSFTTVNAWESGKRQPQHSMQGLLEDLLSRNTINKRDHIEQGHISGLSRTASGFISSVISYDGRKDNYSFTHGIGRWYGCLPSILVRDLVNFCHTDLKGNGKVLINFCGSGTVPLEFSLAGYETKGIDVNPIAFLLSYIKTQKLKPLNRKRLQIILSDAKIQRKIKIEVSAASKKNLVTNDDKWISKESKDIFHRIITYINSLELMNEQLILLTALITRSVDFCEIDKRCTNHYVYKKNLTNKVLFWDAFSEEIININEKLSALYAVKKYSPPNISMQDNRQTSFNNSEFDIVFAHPPYGTTINYYSMSRIQLSILEMVELKKNIKGYDNHELLLRAQMNDQSASTLGNYYKSLSQWITECDRIIKTGGYLIVVIGDSRDKGYLSHPHTEIITYAESIGFKLKELFIWLTENKAGMHVRRKGHHIDHNHILVLKKFHK